MQLASSFMQGSCEITAEGARLPNLLFFSSGTHTHISVVLYCNVEQETCTRAAKRIKPYVAWTTLRCSEWSHLNVSSMYLGYVLAHSAV